MTPHLARGLVLLLVARFRGVDSTQVGNGIGQQLCSYGLRPGLLLCCLLGSRRLRLLLRGHLLAEELEIATSPRGDGQLGWRGEARRQRLCHRLQRAW